MDAVKFLKELKRICTATDCREGCPCYNAEIDICATKVPEYLENDDIENIVSTVEKWSAEHPVKTRLMDFLEKYPDAPLYEEDGGNYPMLCPSVLGYCGNGSSYPCGKCPYDEEPETFCWNLPLE